MFLFCNIEVYSTDGAIIYSYKGDVKLFLDNHRGRKEWKGIACLMVSLSVYKVSVFSPGYPLRRENPPL